MLHAVFFVQPHPEYVLSMKRICERMGVDANKLARRVFGALPPSRQQEIREWLRYYRCPAIEEAA